MACLENYLELIANGFEGVPLVLFVSHSFFRVNAMGLLAVEFLAVGAVVLHGRVIAVLRLLLLVVFAARLGAFAPVAVASAWFALFLR